MLGDAALKKEKPTSLFPQSRYNSMNVYHKASRKTDSRRGSIAFVRTAFFVCVAYIIWLIFHEFTHYYLCLLLGKTGSLSVILPMPQVSCKSATPFSFAESFLYIMSPYLFALTLLIFASRFSDAFIKFIAYSSFFDLQYNLFLTTVLSPVLGSRRNDLYYLLINSGNRFEASVSVGLVLFVILLSYSVFMRGGYLDALREEKYRNAFIILCALMFGNILTLYLI